MGMTATIRWQPFSDKHIDYISNGLQCKMSVAEGAIRSGKSIDNCIIASMYLETCRDKIHLASGSTIANAKLNIGDCNGFGLEHLFRGRCKWGKYKDNDALRIQTKTGEKIVIFAGGGKKDSFKKILGNSYGLWIATEINQHYDSDNSQESFIKVAMGRQVASLEPKILWDLNPSNPNHSIYTQYIDKYKDNFLGGYNYQHFTMADNLSVSEQRRKEIESQYDPTSVWYRREILGQRCVAESLIYPEFANNPEKFKLDKAPFLPIIEVGVDYGGTKSAQSFVAVGFTTCYRDLVVIDSVRITEELDPEMLQKHYIDFCKKIYNKYGRAFRTNYDNAEPVLGRGFKIAAARECLHTNVTPAFKVHILQRIRCLSTLMAQQHFWYLEEAKTVVKALCEAQWDSKHPDERLDNGTSDIDTCDALEYAFEKNLGDILQGQKSFVIERELNLKGK